MRSLISRHIGLKVIVFCRVFVISLSLKALVFAVFLCSNAMVQLGLRFILFKAIPKRVHAGIYAGKGIMFGHVETFSGKK